MDSKQQWERVLAAVEADARRAEALLLADEQAAAAVEEADAAAARVPADWLLPTTNPSSLPPIEQLPAIPEELRERIVALRSHILALQAELTSALRTWQHSQRATLGTGLVGTAAQPPVYVDRHL
jgi:hypothetical protein